MVLHPATEPIRALIKQLEEASLLAKPAIALELGRQTLTLLSRTLHSVDQLKARVTVLERFPELPTNGQ